MNPEVDSNSDAPMFFNAIEWSVNGGAAQMTGFGFLRYPGDVGFDVGDNTLTASVLFSNAAQGVTKGSGETLTANFSVTFESGSAECD